MKAKLNLVILRVWLELKSEKAQDLIEYALLLGFISLAAVASIAPFGKILYGYYIYLKREVNKLPV